MNTNEIDAIRDKLDRAEKHLEKSEYAQAEELAGGVLSATKANETYSKDDEARAFNILGKCCSVTSRCDDALTYYRNAFAAAEAASNLSLQSRAMNGKAWVQHQLAKYHEAIYSAELALAVAEKAEDKKQQGVAFNTIGLSQKELGDFPKALDFLTRSLPLAEQSGDEVLGAIILCNIGSIHSYLSDFASALDFFSRSNEIAERSGDKYLCGGLLLNIGGVHARRADFARALDFFTRSLSLVEEIDRKEAIADVLGNIGECHMFLSDYPRALDYHSRAIALAEAIGYKIMVVYSLISIGSVHWHLADYLRALDYYCRALALAEEIGDKRNIAVILCNIGGIQLELADYPHALEYLNRSLELSEQIGARSQASHCMRTIASVERKLGNLDAACKRFMESLQFRREVLKSNECVAETLLELGRTLLEQRKTDDGMARLEESLALAKELGQKKTASEVHKEMAEAYAKMGNIAKAYEHSQKHYALKEEIFSDKSRQLIDTFNIRAAIANQERDTELQRLRAEKSERETEVQQLRADMSERELSNSTLQLLAQTELLSELRDGLMQVIKKFPMSDGAAKELRERLKTLPCKAVDWEKFDTQFKAAHPEFTKKLLEAHPTLTPTELRMCSLLRMQLRSAEIARLLCLSERTIEHHRAHIRTKMKLKKSEDLIKILAAM